MLFSCSSFCSYLQFSYTVCYSHLHEAPGRTSQRTPEPRPKAGTDWIPAKDKGNVDIFFKKNQNYCPGDWQIDK